MAKPSQKFTDAIQIEDQINEISTPIVPALEQEIPDQERPAGMITFLSIYPESNYYIGNTGLIKFKRGMYETMDPDEIYYFRTHPEAGKTIFEGKFPKHITDEMEREKKFLTKNKEER